MGEGCWRGAQWLRHQEGPTTRHPSQGERHALLEAVLHHALNDASETSTEATPLAIRNVDTAVSAI